MDREHLHRWLAEDVDRALAQDSLPSVVEVDDTLKRRRGSDEDGNFTETKKQRKRLDWYTWADKLSDYHFRAFYRLSRKAFDLLLSYIRDDLRRPEHRDVTGSPEEYIEPELQLSMTLRWLAGGSHTDIQYFHGVSDTCFWSTRGRVLNVIARCKALQWRYPKLSDTAALQRISTGFAAKSSHALFDKCVGIIDGITIELLDVDESSEAWHAALYITRKGLFAFNCQAVCDSNHRFIWYSISSMGSEHDSAALYRTSLGGVLTDAGPLPHDMYLIGDPAYKVFPNILTPFQGTNLSALQESFNFYMSEMQSHIKIAFKKLLNRFGVFWRGLDAKNIYYPSLIIDVCMLLHNFILDIDGRNAKPIYDIGTIVTFCEEMKKQGREWSSMLPDLDRLTDPGDWEGWLQPDIYVDFTLEDARHKTKLIKEIMDKLKVKKLTRPPAVTVE
eukprot:524378-Hanusia_phi.AAC.9